MSDLIFVEGLLHDANGLSSLWLSVTCNKCDYEMGNSLTGWKQSFDSIEALNFVALNLSLEENWGKYKSWQWALDEAVEISQSSSCTIAMSHMRCSLLEELMEWGSQSLLIIWIFRLTSVYYQHSITLFLNSLLDDTVNNLQFFICLFEVHHCASHNRYHNQVAPPFHVVISCNNFWYQSVNRVQSAIIVFEFLNSQVKDCKAFNKAYGG